MKIKLWFKYFTGILILILTGGFAGSVHCQEINLDKMKKFGDLVCYQSLKDPAAWYYLPDQPRLAMEDGKPEFSFMKYSRTEKTGTAGTNTAEGGGIVHFLVTYGTSKDRITAAERRLQEQQPDARIEGPIVYRKGSFALITSFQQDQETLVRTVAVGKAPLMEGQKAAVSMALSRQGAEILWESFKSDTPDISLVFDMEFAGVREPYEATIEADWSRVSNHKRLKAGMKYSWFGADVDMLFQELRQEGAIKITTKGENASMDRIIESANAKLLQVMFDPAPVDDLSRAAAENDSYSSLNQAMKMLNQDQGKTPVKAPAGGQKSSLNLDSPGFRQVIASILGLWATDAHAADASSAGETSKELTPEQNNSLREIFKRGVELKKAEKYQEALETFLECQRFHQELTGKPLPSCSTKYNIAFCLENLKQYNEAIENYKLTADCFGRETADGKWCLEQAGRTEQLAAKENKEKSPETGISTGKPSDSIAQAPAMSASDAYNRARRLDEEAKQSGYTREATQAAIDAYEAYQRDNPAKGPRYTEIDGRIRSLKKRLASAAPEDTATAGTTTSENTQVEEKPLAPVPTGTLSPSSASGTSPAAGTSETNAQNAVPAAANTQTASPSSSTAAKNPGAALKSAAEKKPGFSLVASFQVKNIKRSGKMVYQMNHFRSEKQSFTMTENIGSLFTRYGNDSRIFKAITIDDPVFKQREILVTLDGQDAQTFTKYLNFVTVKMNKHHQSGSDTNDEVVITPESFNNRNNAFSLVYGYKGDTDRNQWLEYQYQVIWSFHGGLEIRSEWDTQNSPMLALIPPYRYRGLTIEGEGEQLQKADVRHAVITVNSRINEKQITTQATIRNQGPAPALHLDIPEGMNSEPGDVSITWFLKGGKKVTSSPQPLEGDIIYWDEVPKEGKI